MSASHTLDTPDWRIYAYDRRHQTTRQVTKAAAHQSVAPSMTLDGDVLYWSTTSRDGSTLAAFRADMRQPGSATRPINNAASSRTAGTNQRRSLHRRHTPGGEDDNTIRGRR